MNIIRTICHLGSAMLLTMSLYAVPGDGPAVRIGDIRWTADSVDAFAVSATGDVLLLGRRSDTSVAVVDPATGVELRRFRGSRRMQHIALFKTLDCSPDGTLCLVSEPDFEADPTAMTRLYRVADGQLLWERNERSWIHAISARLQRGVVWTSDSTGTIRSELRDLVTGDAIRTFDEAWNTVFIDEWHGRIYAGTLVPVGQQTASVIELDATTGAELRRWSFTRPVSACRLKDSDTLFVAGEANAFMKSGTAKVEGVDMSTGRRHTIVECPKDEWYGCGCFQGISYTLKWSLSADGSEALLHQIRGINGFPLTAHRFSNRSECYMNEDFRWPGEQFDPLAPFYVDIPNANLYYLPNGASIPFICLAMESSTNVRDSDAVHALEIVTDGSVLRITLPSAVTGTAEIDIMDVNGRLAGTSMSNVEGRSIVVPIADLSSGGYFCSVAIGSMKMSGRFAVVR